MTETAIQTRFRIEGMDCAGCATKIDTAVRRLPGVGDVMLSATAGTMAVRHTAESDLDALKEKVTELGYGIAPFTSAAKPAGTAAHGRSHEEAREATHNHDHASTTGPWWKSRKGLLTIASGVALVVAYGIGKAAPSIAPWAFVAAMLVGLCRSAAAPSRHLWPGHLSQSKC